VKIVVLGHPDDVRGALLAGATFCRTIEEALADPEVGLIVSDAASEDSRVLSFPKGGSDAAAGQHRGGGRRGA
jgi:hypothetical protein